MRYLFPLVILLLTGCQGFGGPKGIPFSGLNEFQGGKGQVYVYRPSSFVMGMAIPSLEVNGQSAISVRNRSYMVYELDPGKHKFVLTSNGNWSAPKMEFIANVEVGKRQFFRLSADVGSIYLIGSTGGAVTINGYLGSVSEKIAVAEMRGLLYTGSWSPSLEDSE